MLVPTGVKYQPTPRALSETPAALPKLLTLMPTWPGSTRLHEVSGTMAIKGMSASGAKRRSCLFMVPTPDELVELARQRHRRQESPGERDQGEQRRAGIGEVAVQVEERRHEEGEAGDLPDEERAASQPEADEPQIQRFHESSILKDSQRRGAAAHRMVRRNIKYARA